MIDAKQAVQIAKQHAKDVLEAYQDISRDSALNPGPEEIERDEYKGQEVWSITLSVARKLESLPALSRFSADPIQYKRFLIDVETGQLLAMKLREVATQ